MPSKNEEQLNLCLRQLNRGNGNVHCVWCNADTLMHRHVDFYEFGLITRGQWDNTFGDTVSQLKPGDLFLFDVGKSHRLSFDNAEVSQFSMCLEAPYFQLLLQIYFPDRTIFNKNGFLFRNLDQNEFNFMLMTANALTAQEKADTEKVKLFFHNALHLLLQTPETQPTNYDLVVDDILEKIRNYTYLTCPIQDIYDQYPHCPTTLIKIFKERTGETIIHFQTNARLDCAARFLLETNHSIERIATNLGFISSSYFFRAFKKRFGLTPSEYRINAKLHPENF